MLTTTMQAIIEDTVDANEARDHLLYLVRDEGVVWYIGQSVDPVRRLQAHLGLTWRAGSNLGQLFQRRLPKALQWTVVLYTLVDCEPLVEKYILPKFAPYYTLALYYDPARVCGAMTFAEQALIDHHRPSLNVHMKTFHSSSLQQDIRPVNSSGWYLK